MKAIKRNKSGLLLNILQEKCPHCGKGDVYEKGTGLFHMPVMKDDCEVCHYHFDREPGYFLGAMYISYGLAVAQAVAAFLIVHFGFPDLPTIWKPIAILLVVLAFAKKNYKLSRVIYIHIFPW